MSSTSSGLARSVPPWRPNIITMVKSSAMRVRGLMRGEEDVVEPRLALAGDEQRAGEEPGGEGDAQVDEHGAGDLAHGDVDHAALQAEEARQHGDEEPGVGAEEEDLEDAVERHQAGG